MVGGAVGGEEAEGGDLQAVPIKNTSGVALVIDVLGNPLAEGALTQGNPRLIVSDCGGEELGAAGGMGAGQDDQGLVRQVAR